MWHISSSSLTCQLLTWTLEFDTIKPARLLSLFAFSMRHTLLLRGSLSLQDQPLHLRSKGRMSTPRAKPKYYLTTPLYYTNGLPHIGHTYSTIVADVIRRYKRMRGLDVFMTTGADEHGVNVERSAKKAGKTPQEFSTAIAAQWRQIWDDFGIAGDEFISERPMSGTTGRSKGCSNAAGTMVLSRRATIPASIAYMTMPTVVDAGPSDTMPGLWHDPRKRRYRGELLLRSSMNFEAKASRLLRRQSRFHTAGKLEGNEVLSFVQRWPENLSITRTTIRVGHTSVPGEALTQRLLRVVRTRSLAI